MTYVTLVIEASPRPAPAGLGGPVNEKVYNKYILPITFRNQPFYILHSNYIPPGGGGGGGGAPGGSGGPPPGRGGGGGGGGPPERGGGGGGGGGAPPPGIGGGGGGGGGAGPDCTADCSSVTLDFSSSARVQ